MNVYLIGPIDLATSDDQKWKAVLEQELIKRPVDGSQWTLFDPFAPWKLCNEFKHSSERCKFIEAVNLAALRNSRMVIAGIPSNIVSIGSPIELEWADDANKTVIVATDIPYGKNVYLTNRVKEENYIVRAAGETVQEWMSRVAQAAYKATADDLGYKIEQVVNKIGLGVSKGISRRNAVDPAFKIGESIPMDAQAGSGVLMEKAEA